MVREPTFLILAAVAADPLHGYGILQSVEELSGGRVRLRAGTLYAALDRLVREGSLVVDREQVVDGRLRRYYRITEAGFAVLRRGSRISRSTCRRRGDSSCGAASWGSHDARAALPASRPGVSCGLAARARGRADRNAARGRRAQAHVDRPARRPPRADLRARVLGAPVARQRLQGALGSLVIGIGVELTVADR